jgi:hypothetical protein
MHLLTMSKSDKVRFSNPNYQKDCTKIVIQKINIKYIDTIASNYIQY